jgi:cytochrome P450
VHALSIFAWQALLRGYRELDEMLLRSAKATATAQPPALAALLLAGDGPLGVLDDEELQDQIMSLLFAGHETTASTTAWILYWLGRDERARRDVIAELTTTSNDGSDPAQVPLLHAVTQETLRLSPPAIIAGKRMLTADGELLGRPLPAGTLSLPVCTLRIVNRTCLRIHADSTPAVFLVTELYVSVTFRSVAEPGAVWAVSWLIGGPHDCRCCAPSLPAALCQPEAGIPELRGPALTLAQGLRMSIIPHRMAPRNIPA